MTEKTPDGSVKGPQSPSGPMPDAITGVEAMMGKGVKEPLGFWAEAWSRVIKRPGAVLGLSWAAIVAFFAVFAPLIASGHPVVMRELDTRTAADAAAQVEAELSQLDAVDVGDIRQSVRLELRHHAPSLTPEDVLGDLSFEERETELFDEAGRLIVKRSVSDADIEEVVSRVAGFGALDETGGVADVSSPLLANLTAADWVILVLTLGGVALVFWPGGAQRSSRLLWLILMAAQAALVIVGATIVNAKLGDRDVAVWLLELQRLGLDDNPAPDAWRPFVTLMVSVLAALTTAVMVLIPSSKRFRTRLLLHVATGSVAAAAVGVSWGTPPERFDYAERERAGEIEATYTLIPFSPNERLVDRNTAGMPPGRTTGQALARRVTTFLPFRGEIGDGGVVGMVEATESLPLSEETIERLIEAIDAAAESLPAEFAAGIADQRGGGDVPETLADLRVGEAEAFLRIELADEGRPYLLGTDATGQDVLSQLLHACRLSVSIGLVATGIAALIGVTMGALMGYFGGVIDLALYRVVEIFMAIPVLFLLIVAAAVLPRNTYVMMAIIGCFTWHGMARFTRAEFYKLRNQDFVQSAQAVGLPLRSVLFKHMLPNGVTPVLVDASFRIALAILFESILSYLGLGPEDQASWGRLLSDATQGASGGVDWWLATFPGFAIFMTVLGYNLIGESLRDAIDPKLKKARV